MNMLEKVVLITGASSGIGEACARVFGRAGADLVLAARRLDRLESLAKSLEKEGIRSLVIQTDVSQVHEVEAMVKAALDKWNRIDFLINNAGAGCVGKIADLDLKYARQVFDVNFFGALHCIQAVVPVMRKQQQGHILNISSVVGKRSVPEIGYYCATKFALNAVGDSLRLELRKQGIHVTTICPGLTETEFNQATLRPERIKPVRSKWRGQSSERVAEAILKATVKRPREVHLTIGGKFLVGMERLWPWLVDQILKLQDRVYGNF